MVPRLTALLAALCVGMPALATEDAFNLPAAAAAVEATDPILRLEAATAALRRLDPSAGQLAAAALAADASMLMVEPLAEGGFRVRNIDPQRARSLIALDLRLRDAFGAPRVLVQPGRPVHPSDRAAAATLGERLKSLGFDISDPQGARASRTAGADRAVQAGADPSRAALALQAHPDFRVSAVAQEATDAEPRSTYGLTLQRCEALIRIEATRGGDAARIPVAEAAATRFGRDATTAQAKALQSACDLGAMQLAMSLAQEWMQLGGDARGRTIEIDGSPSGEAMRHPRPVEVLEAVPGVRTVIRLPAGDSRSPADFGTPLLVRPGYALVDASGTGLAWLWPAALVAAATTAVATLVAWRLRRDASRTQA